MLTTTNVNEFPWGLYDEVAKKKELESMASCV